MATIYGANTLSTGYDVANSLRFNGGSSDDLVRTPSSSGNNNKSTISVWVKRSRVDEEDFIIYGFGGSANRCKITFLDNNKLQINTIVSSSNNLVYETNRLFRDVSAWYHIVIAFDSTLGTAGDRVRLYINGVEETSFATETHMGQNTSNFLSTSGTPVYIGSQASGNYFDGYMAEFVFIDGQQLDPTSFGEFDSNSPNIWKPKDVSGLTFGTNGFYLDFENASSLGADVSGNSNNFTVNNLTSVDQSTDTCTNNGCTWNNLIRSTATFTQGNLVYQAPSSNPVFGSLTSFGVSSGKWYAECKYHAGSNHYGILGVADEVFATLNDLGSATNTDLGKTGSLGHSDAQNSTIAYVINTGAYRNNNSNTSWGSGGGDGDIINIALDRDNRKVYFGVNGTYGNSSNPATGSNGIDISSLVTGDIYFLGVTNDTGASETVLDFNFGSGFGQTTVSTGNSDANGYGNFEYSVPSGYYAWNTKNLAEFG